MTKKLSWTEKLHDNKNLPKVEVINEKNIKRWGPGTIVIPAPIEVDEFMRKVPKGKLTTITEIRKALAEKHNATFGCPLTTGIFTNIAAKAAVEQQQKGEKNVTPYWRTLKADGMLNEKFPGGVDIQKELLESEGHKISSKGKKFYVTNYLDALIEL
ncbi:MAG: MGMT family protein [Crenarchaeota archaeon]|nr:MGMT family protein [Thermoproteota archaeon]